MNQTREQLPDNSIEDFTKQVELGAYENKIAIEGNSSPASDLAILEQTRASEALFLAALNTGGKVGDAGIITRVKATGLSKQAPWGQLQSFSTELHSNENIGFGYVLLNSLFGGAKTSSFQDTGVLLPAVTAKEEVICGICSPDFPGTGGTTPTATLKTQSDPAATFLAAVDRHGFYDTRRKPCQSIRSADPWPAAVVVLAVRWLTIRHRS